jgi:2-C-methyl-D-erythritol 4-phosphate cytidylyltransferase
MSNPDIEPTGTSTTKQPAADVPGDGPAARVAVVVPAAGLGRRLGDQGPKALVELAGKPLLAWALADLEASACVTSVVVATHPEAVPAVRALIDGEGGSGLSRSGQRFPKVVAVVEGGGTRQQSVAAGLAAVPADATHVAVHDAARPLAGPGLLDELLALLIGDTENVSGIVPGSPVTDTIREIDHIGRSKGIVDRDRLRGMQTPQLFLREVLERAHKLAQRDELDATDEAALVERAGELIRVVPGPVENLKITTTLDLVVAEALLARRAGTLGMLPPEHR